MLYYIEIDLGVNMMLIGKKVRLRVQERKDMEFFHKMYDDPKVQQFDLNYLAGFSREYMEKDFDKTRKESLMDNGRERFVIESLEGVPVGGINYFMPNPLRNIFMIGITIASDYWSCGYGQDAINTLLAYLFLKREAIKVELGVRETNSRAIRCYEKCGFIKESLIRDADFSGGKPISYCHMGILKEEFLKRSDI